MRQRPVHLAECPRAARSRPFRLGFAPRGHPLCHPPGQPARAAQRPVRGEGRPDAREPLSRPRGGERGPPVPPSAVSRPEGGPSTARHPAIPRRCPQGIGPDGLFVLQTDNPDYWLYFRRVVPVFFHFEEHPGPWPDAPEGRSRREILARSRGLTIFRGLGRKRDDVAPETARKLAESLPPPSFRSRGPWCDLDAVEGM